MANSDSLSLDEKRARLAKYSEFLPSNLRKEFYDIIVVHPTENEEEEQRARNYTSKLKENVQFDSGDLKAVLFDDFAVDIGSKLKRMEEAVNRCSLRFIYITESFLHSETEQRLFTESALCDSLTNPDTRNTMIPIFDDTVRSEKEIPLYLNSLCGLFASTDREPFHFSKVKRLVEEKVDSRLAREKKQGQEQLEWAGNFKL